MRIVIAQMKHETNTFSPVPTPLARFAVDGLVPPEGPDAYQARYGVRLLVSMLALAAAISAVVPVWIARRRAAQGYIVLDERDELILARAPSYQAFAMLIVCGAWMIALTEIFWTQGSVPIAYLALSFWSVLVVWALALPAGLLLGYRVR